MVVKTITRKKTHETTIEELLNSFRENDAVDELELNIANVINPGEFITIIHRYEEIINTQNKKTIGYVPKQRPMLKNFRNTEDFTENVRQSRSTIYFEIGLYKFFKKNPSLEKLYYTLSSHFFRNHSKVIKKVSKSNANLLSQTRRTVLMIL